jgi:hypothetical protein
MLIASFIGLSLLSHAIYRYRDMSKRADIANARYFDSHQDVSTVSNVNMLTTGKAKKNNNKMILKLSSIVLPWFH